VYNDRWREALRGNYPEEDNMAANINAETGIRYGVIDARDVPLLDDEIFTNGTDETFEAHRRDCIKQIAAVLDELGQRNCERTATDIVDNFEWDRYEADELEHTYIDSDGNKFLRSHLGGAPLIWCIKTDRIVKVRSLCSPCVPNAADLNSGESDDGYECYGIPAAWLSEAD
jgi:hypothetical protein